MSLDIAVQTLLDRMRGMPPFELSTVEDARASTAAFLAFQEPQRLVSRVVDTTYAGSSEELPIRIYVPEGTGPFPVVVYFHGGGFVTGDLIVSEELCRALANDVGAIVAAVGYRLAPEHKFPAATDDTFAALCWIADHVAQFGGDPRRLAVHGDSAGGNLAAVTALRARDEGGPSLTCQVLVYPVIEPYADTRSRHEFREGYVLNAAGMDWFWDHYLTTSADADNPYVDPSKATDLAGLPPTLIVTMENEVPRDEAEYFGEQLAEAGVPTEVVRVDGLVHGVYWITAAVPRGNEIRALVVRFLVEQFAGRTIEGTVR
ncbi:alpha/beta hydrolase [Rhodococcus erythropolis]|uniref:alpha/beta hydrolase n=1 Tax=Rhodococcus erythropolis TaxID=1833 RepID=UPI00294981BE|nr:alpha/beta hydrolase [Rhodococcus erythropolis]MDV6212700.1 alpha/beta hydrolase [Rhodococcus erythropolis]